MANTYNLLDISFSDEGRAKMMKVILGYESALRGLSSAQTFSSIVLEAVDLTNYPNEVLEQIGNIREEARVRAVQKSLEEYGARKSA